MVRGAAGGPGGGAEFRKPTTAVADRPAPSPSAVARMAASSAAATQEDLYAVLGVDAAAGAALDERAFAAAFRRRALIVHPDKNGGKMSEAFHRLVHAYTVLSDPVTRAAYDDERESPRPSTPPSTSSDPEQVYAAFFGERSPFKAFTPKELKRMRRYTDKFFASPAPPPPPPRRTSSTHENDAQRMLLFDAIAARVREEEDDSTF